MSFELTDFHYAAYATCISTMMDSQYFSKKMFNVFIFYF